MFLICNSANKELLVYAEIIWFYLIRGHEGH